LSTFSTKSGSKEAEFLKATNSLLKYGEFVVYPNENCAPEALLTIFLAFVMSETSQIRFNCVTKSYVYIMRRKQHEL
jgi:hypothetical protein